MTGSLEATEVRAAGGARIAALPFMPTPDKMPGPSGLCRHSPADARPRADPSQRTAHGSTAALHLITGHSRPRTGPGRPAAG
jgi:hypothetical protein